MGNTLINGTCARKAKARAVTSLHDTYTPPWERAAYGVVAPQRVCMRVSADKDSTGTTNIELWTKRDMAAGLSRVTTPLQPQTVDVTIYPSGQIESMTVGHSINHTPRFQARRRAKRIERSGPVKVRIVAKFAEHAVMAYIAPSYDESVYVVAHSVPTDLYGEAISRAMRAFGVDIDRIAGLPMCFMYEMFEQSGSYMWTVASSAGNASDPDLSDDEQCVWDMFSHTVQKHRARLACLASRLIPGQAYVHDSKGRLRSFYVHRVAPEIKETAQDVCFVLESIAEAFVEEDSGDEYDSDDGSGGERDTFHDDGVGGYHQTDR